MTKKTTHTGEGGASSSNFQQNGNSQSNSQNAEATNAPAQGRGRGKKRWIPMNVSQDAFVPPAIPSQSARQPQRRQANGNAYRPSGNRHGVGYQQRNGESSRAASASVPSQPAQIPARGPRHVPGAEPAVSTLIPSNQAPPSGSASASHQSPTAPRNNQVNTSGKKNRRQRGRGKNQAQPDKEPTTFLSLPFELRERIMTESYRMTLEELPDSHPKIHGKILDMSPNAVRLRRRRPAAVTKLRNPAPPAGLTNKQRKGFLWRNPGQWGPVFQVMYTCKQLYEEGRAIRYRHIRINAWFADYHPVTKNDDLLLNRLSYQAIRDYTREVRVSFAQHQPTVTIKNLVEALGNMKALKHLCVVVKGSRAVRNRTGTDADLLLFFGLKLETLTFLWSWANENPFDLDYDFVQDATGHGYITSPAESWMVNCVEAWMEKTYNKSPWYKAYEPRARNGPRDLTFGDLLNPNVLENTDKVAPGKVMKHVYKLNENQFYFAPAEDRNITPPPDWGSWLPADGKKNPYNHPDQEK